jgi:hypothetical protein
VAQVNHLLLSAARDGREPEQCLDDGVTAPTLWLLINRQTPIGRSTIANLSGSLCTVVDPPIG